MGLKSISNILDWFGTLCLIIVIFQLVRLGIPLMQKEVGYFISRLFRR